MPKEPLNTATKKANCRLDSSVVEHRTTVQKAVGSLNN